MADDGDDDIGADDGESSGGSPGGPRLGPGWAPNGPWMGSRVGESQAGRGAFKTVSDITFSRGPQKDFIFSVAGHLNGTSVREPGSPQRLATYHSGLSLLSTDKRLQRVSSYLARCVTTAILEMTASRLIKNIEYIRGFPKLGIQMDK